MKLFSLGLLILLCSSVSQAQHEVRCHLVDGTGSWPNTITLGSCATNPQLWKRVTYNNSAQSVEGLRWYSLCDICPAAGSAITVTEPSVFSTGGCFAQDGFVLEECWPIFNPPEVYFEPLYCGDVFFQVTQSQTVGSFNPETVTNCVKNPSLTQKFDCVSGNTVILPTHHGRCPTTPSTQEECEAASWFWNPFSDTCDQDPPPTCTLLPELCENGIWSFEWCGCVPYNTPIVIDVSGNGFDLSSSASGVAFNLNNVGGREKIAWTTLGSDDAWLALDRNQNGIIDDGTELFGDVTSQAPVQGGESKNGFRALADFDKAANGGNDDGQIDQADVVFSSLRLWQDINHNGISEPNELHPLFALALAAIELDYRSSKRTDRHGNRFNFRAKVKAARTGDLGRWAWDVLLVRSL